MRQTYDDGTWVDTDSAGNVTSYSDTNGQVFQPDRTVFTQFIGSILGGLSSAINNRLATVAPAPVPVAPASQGLITLALLGLGAYALFQSAK